VTDDEVSRARNAQQLDLKDERGAAGNIRGTSATPYAMPEGHTNCALPPTLIFCTPSVQQGIT
jgi:hypothetical protein